MSSQWPCSSSPSPCCSFLVTNLVHALALKCYLCKFVFHSWTLSRVFVSCVVKQLSPNDCFPSVPTRPTFLTTVSTVSYHFHLSIEAAFRTSLTNICSLGCENDNVSHDLTYNEQFLSDPKSTTVKTLADDTPNENKPLSVSILHKVVIGVTASGNRRLCICLKLISFCLFVCLLKIKMLHADYYSRNELCILHPCFFKRKYLNTVFR